MIAMALAHLFEKNPNDSMLCAEMLNGQRILLLSALLHEQAVALIEA
jgi:hypothetical protein